MDTGRLKRFATEARTNLMDGVRLRLRKLGFDERGHAVKAPELISGGTIWNGEEYPEEFYAQWIALRDLLLKRGVREVVENAAYTWFNRMMAIRILTRNNLCESILDTDDMTGLPQLLAEARMGRVPEMSDQQRRRYEWLINDDMRTTDQFAVLLTAWCHANPVINSCFGSIDGFVELLLPDNILKEGGFLSLLNHTEFITEEDFHSAELIGWLYQFYISDRKDEVFAKKGKVAADEIPAATQIFTPNWIVKYIVQNTILPQVDAPEEVVEECKYLVKPDGSDCRKVELEEMKVADFACGSGHILNECFDLLYDLYMAEAYSRREAIEYIFTKNLLGIDIDLRAKQLATFALLLKACQKDSTFADAHCMPRVLTVPEFTAILKTSKYEDEDGGHGKNIKHVFFQDSVTDAVAAELENTFTLLRDADSLGSIIKFELSASALRAIKDTTEYWQSKDAANRPEFVTDLLPAVDFIIALTDSYDAIVMNPPYMPTSRVDVLKDYAVKNYPDGKPDLYSVFMDVCMDRLKNGGKYGMINMQSWMFLSSFEALRKKIISSQPILDKKGNETGEYTPWQHIDSLLHLGPHTFDELSGEVVQNAAFVISKEHPSIPGIYFRLIDGKNCNTKREMFLAGDNRYVVADQQQFEKIPGAPIAYWVSDNFRLTFNYNNLGTFGTPRSGIMSGNTTLFTRFFWELAFNSISFETKNHAEIIQNGYKWFPVVEGGGLRKWYGNLETVINLKNDGEDIKNTSPNYRLRDPKYYFKKGITWSMVSSTSNTFRVCPEGVLFGNASPVYFHKSYFEEILGFLNTPISQLGLVLLNPTINCTCVDVERLPFISNKDLQIVNCLVSNCIDISKQDWDAHETSWDFGQNPLVSEISNLPKNCVVFNDPMECVLGIIYPERVRCDANLEERQINRVLTPGLILDCVLSYQDKWTKLFRKLHKNEEELNRQFIAIYGLENEIAPGVPFDEITILQQGEAEFETEGEAEVDGDDVDGTVLVWKHDVLIKQLISYIVGVWMGRYRLDRPGLHIAYPNPTEEELAEYPFSITGNQTLKIDADAIIPVLTSDAPFYDNLRNYVVEFVRKVWGDESLTENINFIEKCLGKSLDDYLMKDFWKYHKKMYQNRPIYWEFASKKGAFRAIVYAHRMDRFTVEVLRSKYLLPYIGHIERKIAALEIRQDELTTSERRELDSLRTKTLPELREYHDRVERIAAESSARTEVFDLDDGIIKNHALFGDIVTKLK